MCGVRKHRYGGVREVSRPFHGLSAAGDRITFRDSDIGRHGQVGELILIRCRPQRGRSSTTGTVPAVSGDLHSYTRTVPNSVAMSWVAVGAGSVVIVRA